MKVSLLQAGRTSGGKAGAAAKREQPASRMQRAGCTLAEAPALLARTFLAQGVVDLEDAQAGEARLALGLAHQRALADLRCKSDGRQRAGELGQPESGPTLALPPMHALQPELGQPQAVAPQSR